jgi:hypothetical protein
VRVGYRARRRIAHAAVPASSTRPTISPHGVSVGAGAAALTGVLVGVLVGVVVGARHAGPRFTWRTAAQPHVPQLGTSSVHWLLDASKGSIAQKVAQSTPTPLTSLQLVPPKPPHPTLPAVAPPQLQQKAAARMDQLATLTRIKMRTAYPNAVCRPILSPITSRHRIPRGWTAGTGVSMPQTPGAGKFRCAAPVPCGCRCPSAWWPLGGQRKTAPARNPDRRRRHLR